jgi:hypothetical protein
MARTKLVPVQLVRNAGTSIAASYKAIDSTLVTAGAYIDVMDVKTGPMIINVTNTTGATKVLTVKAGDSGFAQSVVGDLACTIAATTGNQAIQLDSMRFLQVGSTINIDFATGFEGAISIILPAD